MILSAFAFSILAGLVHAQGLVSFLESRDDLSTLLSVLQQVPELVEQLSSAGGITILAPTNDAIEGFQQEFDDSVQVLTGDNTTAIANVLSYHVLNGTFTAADLTAGGGRQLYHTLFDNGLVTGGQVVAISGSADSGVYIDSGTIIPAQVQEADIAVEGSEIIIHTIGAVLELPPTLSELGQRFQGSGEPPAIAALRDAGLLEEVESLPDMILFNPTPVTGTDVVIDFDSVPADELSEILQYHVVAGEGDLLTVGDVQALDDGTTLETLQGGSVTITSEEDSQGDSRVFINGVLLTSRDMLVANGIVHDIEGVLDPSNNTTGPATGGDAEQDDDEPGYQGPSYEGGAAVSKASAGLTAASLGLFWTLSWS